MHVEGQGVREILMTPQWWQGEILEYSKRSKRVRMHERLVNI